MDILTKDEITLLQKSGNLANSKEAEKLDTLRKAIFDDVLTVQDKKELKNLFSSQKNEVWTLQTKQNRVIVAKYLHANILMFTRVFEWVFTYEKDAVFVQIRAAKIDFDKEGAPSFTHFLESETKRINENLRNGKTVFDFLSKIMC